MTGEAAPLGILVADDHPIVLDGLERVFDLEADLRVVGRCRRTDEVAPKIAATRPDVLVLDLRMPPDGGLAVLEALRGVEAPATVLLTAAIDESEVVEALRLGTRGIVLKESAPERLVDAIRSVAAGAEWIDPTLLGAAFRALRSDRDGLEVLTQREREIAQRVAEGLSNRQISERLNITEGTVKIHLHNVFEKLGIRSRLQLALLVRGR